MQTRNLEPGTSVCTATLGKFTSLLVNTDTITFSSPAPYSDHSMLHLQLIEAEGNITGNGNGNRGQVN